MFQYFKNKKKEFVFISSMRLLVSFLTASLVFSPSASQAQSLNLLNLPIPGAMVMPTPAFVPVLLKGMTIDPTDPLKFDFIVDSGNSEFTQDQVKEESEKLVKYFLASMTVPKDDMWVNLSPYEKDRIVPDELGKTGLGRDLLAQDYILKQLTASLMYPEEELGKEFWDKIYQRAQEEFGTSEIPVNTFNKVWILPEAATVYEHENTVYVVNARLKVMLDSDYEAMTNSVEGVADSNGLEHRANSVDTDTMDLSKQIIKEIILPEIEKEVNEGKNFAPLRQIYHSLILAKWYKETVKNSLLNKVYTDQNKIAGIGIENPEVKDEIYDQYMQAYKKGVFNYIKEDYDRLSDEVIPRKYFSGGIPLASTLKVDRSASPVSVKEIKNGYTLEVSVTPQKDGKSIENWSKLGTVVLLVMSLCAAGGCGRGDSGGSGVGNNTQETVVDVSGWTIDQLRIGLSNLSWPTQRASAKELFKRNDSYGITLARDLLVWPRIANLDHADGGFYLYSIDYAQIVELGAISIQPLIDNLENVNADTDSRKWSARLLGEIGVYSEVFDVLVSVFENVSGIYAAWHKAEALNGLSILIVRQPDAVSKINELLDINNGYISEVRSAAAYAADIIKDMRTVNVLINALNDPNFLVKVSSIKALGSIGGKEAVDALISALLTEPSKYVRIPMIEALGEIGDDSALPVLEQIRTTDADSNVRLAAENAIKKISASSPIDSLVPLLAQRDMTEDELLNADIDVLMITGNDDFNTYRKVLDLKSRGIGKYILISGGDGRLTKDIKRVADYNKYSVDFASEAEMIRDVMVQMAERNPEWTYLVEYLKNKNFTILEKEARFTVENFTKGLKALGDKGLLAKGKKLKLLYIQKPLQQLRTKGQFNYAFKNEIESGKIEGISFTVDPAQEDITSFNIVGDMARIIANAQAKDLDGNSNPNWIMDDGVGLEFIDDIYWRKALMLLNEMSEEDRFKIKEIVKNLMKDVHLDAKGFVRELSGEIKAFAEAIVSSPITEDQAEMILKEKTPKEYHSLITYLHKRRIIALYEGKKMGDDVPFDIEILEPEILKDNQRLIIKTAPVDLAYAKVQPPKKGDWWVIPPVARIVVKNAPQFSTWMAILRDDANGKEEEITTFLSYQDFKTKKKFLSGSTPKVKTNKAQVLKEALEAFEETTLGKDVLGKEEKFKVNIRVARNILMTVDGESGSYVVSKSAQEKDRVVFVLDEGLLGYGGDIDFNKIGLSKERIHELTVFLVHAQLYRMALAQKLKFWPGDRVNMNAFLEIREVEFLYYSEFKDDLIKMLGSAKGPLNRVSNSIMTALNNYNDMKVKRVDNDEQVADREIEVVNNRLKSMYTKTVSDSQGGIVHKVFQFDESQEKEDFARLHEILGEFYIDQKDYKRALRQYSHALFYKPNNSIYREKVISIVADSVEEIGVLDVRDFSRIWGTPASTAEEMWKKIKKITLIEELDHLPESRGDDGKVKTRLDQIDEAVEFLGYLDSIATDFNQGTTEDDFYEYLNAKRLRDPELGEKTPDLDKEYILEFLKTYALVAKDDGRNQNDSTKKILRLSAILLQYSRVLHGDESLDAWEIIPKLLFKLGLASDEREQVLALTSLHRNFGTLFFGEGSPTFSAIYFEKVKTRLQAMEEEQISNEPTMDVEVSDSSEIQETFLKILDSSDVFKGLKDFSHVDSWDGPLKNVKVGGTIFELFPFMAELKTKFFKSKGVSIFDHTLLLIKFISLIEKGGSRSYESINEGKEGRLISRDTFDIYNKAFNKWIGREEGVEDSSDVKKKRRLIYLSALLHDSGEYRLLKGKELHEEKSAIFLKIVLNKMGLVQGKNENQGRIPYDDTDLAMFQWVVLSHVDLGTIRFGERTVEKLYANAFRPKRQTKKQRYSWLQALSLINTADVYATSGGENLNDDHFDHFSSVLTDPDYLDREFSEGLFERRIRIFSSNRPGELDKAKYKRVMLTLDEIKAISLEDYEKIVENFGNPKMFKIMHFGIYFMQALRGEDMIKMMYMLSVIAEKQKEMKNKIEIIQFTAGFPVAPFTADPIHEIMGNYSVEKIHEWSTNEDLKFEDSGFPEDIKRQLIGNANFYMSYDKKEKTLLVDNKKLADIFRYTKLASITAADWVVSKARPVLTNNHIISLIFLSNMGKLPVYRSLKRNWSKIRLLTGFYGEQRGAINLEKAAEMFDGLTLEEAIRILIFYRNNRKIFEGAQWNPKNEQSFWEDRGKKDERILSELKKLKDGQKLVKFFSIEAILNEHGLPINENAILKKYLSLLDAIKSLINKEELTEGIIEISKELDQVQDEINAIKDNDEAHLVGFEDFMARITIKNGIWNMRKFSEIETHKKSVFRLLYILYRLSSYFKEKEGGSVSVRMYEDINVVKFSHELDMGYGPDTKVFENMIHGLSELNPSQLEAIIENSAKEDPFDAVNRILNLKDHAIKIENQNGDIVDTIYIDLTSGVSNEEKNYFKADKSKLPITKGEALGFTEKLLRRAGLVSAVGLLNVFHKSDEDVGLEIRVEKDNIQLVKKSMFFSNGVSGDPISFDGINPVSFGYQIPFHPDFPSMILADIPFSELKNRSEEVLDIARNLNKESSSPINDELSQSSSPVDILKNIKVNLLGVSLAVFVSLVGVSTESEGSEIPTETVGNVSLNEVADELVEYLGGDDEQIILKSIESLVRAGELVLPSLQKGLLEGYNNQLKANAALVIGLIGKGNSDTMNALDKALEDPDPGVRLNVIFAISKVFPDSPEYWTVKLDMLSVSDPDPNVRKSAKNAAWQVFQSNRLSELINDLDVKVGKKFGSAFRKIMVFGKEAIEPLSKVIRDRSESAQKRSNAIFALANIDPPTVGTLETFKYIIRSKDFDERKGDYIGFMAEHRILSKNLTPIFIELLDDHRPLVRANSLAALYALGANLKSIESRLRGIVSDLTKLEFERRNALFVIGNIENVDKNTLIMLQRLVNSSEESTVIKELARKTLKKFSGEVSSSISNSEQNVMDNTLNKENLTDDVVGGIDLNKIDVDRQGSRVNVHFDQMDMEALMNMNIDGFVPVIINITPLPSVFPLLGLEPRREDEYIASLN